MTGLAMRTYVVLTLVLAMNLFDRVQSDALALSIAGLEQLVGREKILIDNLELYLNALERKVDVVRSNLERMRAENLKAQENVEAYLMNPLQAFSLMRRLQSDWMYWELYMQKPVGEEYAREIAKSRSTLPTEEELNEAIDGIVRLQDIYELHPLEMARGKLNGVQYSATLSAIDCYAIAYYLHGSRENYEDAAQWFHVAMNLYKDDDTMNEVLEFDLTKVLQLYAQTLAKQDEHEKAIVILNQAIVRDPGNIKIVHQKMIWEVEIKANAKIPKLVPKVKNLSIGDIRYRKGCQGLFPQRKPKLYCIYNTTTNDFLKLAPLKMELINLDPYMVLYHDVITETEMDVLKGMAKPKLTRATVYDAVDKKGIGLSTRTSKFAWFADNTNVITERVNQRLADMTGFDLYRSEMLQVMNYGIGGHYDTHYDFFDVPRTHVVVNDLGNRIATALFYMSDVEQGGATVFPNIELTVYPKKGACIMWYNLDSRGDGDKRTLHAACPVLYGSKWICNKWIRDKQQLFIRPCRPE